MASSSSLSTQQLTVLRIKRKRNENPLNALLVHNSDMKKSKVREGCHDSVSDDNLLFTYSGTVDEQQIDSTKHVVKNFQTIYQQVVYHDGAHDKEKTKRRDEKKAQQKLSRYRVVTEKRKDCDCVDDKRSQEENEIERMYKIFDVVAEDSNGNSLSAKMSNLQGIDESVREEEETVLCNNVEMIREKLHISDDQPKAQSTDPEYVYDLYLAPGGALIMGDNEIINVEEYEKSDYYEHRGCQQRTKEEECYDDEDDENDENNWRNEYPEDKSDSGSENERWGGGRSDGSYGGGDGAQSSSDEDNVYDGYRHGAARLKFDPYAKDETPQEEYFYTVGSDDPDDDT